MRIPISRLHIYGNLPDLRRQLLTMGTLTETHLEIDDAALATIVKPPKRGDNSGSSVPVHDAQNCGGETSSMRVVELDEPTPEEMVKNFATAMAQWLSAGLPIASKEVALERAGICAVCPHWDAKARRVPLTGKFLGKCRAKACGCTKAKFWLGTSTCPEGKWTR